MGENKLGTGENEYFYKKEGKTNGKFSLASRMLDCAVARSFG